MQTEQQGLPCATAGHRRSLTSLDQSAYTWTQTAPADTGPGCCDRSWKARRERNKSVRTDMHRGSKSSRPWRTLCWMTYYSKALLWGDLNWSLSSRITDSLFGPSSASAASYPRGREESTKCKPDPATEHHHLSEKAVGQPGQTHTVKKGFCCSNTPPHSLLKAALMIQQLTGGNKP